MSRKLTEIGCDSEPTATCVIGRSMIATERERAAVYGCGEIHMAGVLIGIGQGSVLDHRILRIQVWGLVVSAQHRGMLE